MRLMDDFRERATQLQDDLREHGTTIAGAVRSNTYAVALVALVSCVALIVGLTALVKARG
jgi:hypothetical protein